MADNKTSIIISAVDQTGAALKSAEAGLAGLGAQAGRVSGILSGFAALAGATAFGGIIKGAIDAADELDDLAQKSGATVESLSAMKGVAKIAGADMEQVAGGLAKLSKNMVEAANGSGDAAKVLTALGISVTDNAGKLKSTDQVMVEFAKSLQNVGSGTEKVAAAQMVLGKSGAQLLPFLNDLAAAGELQVKVTAEQAAAAANLNDNLNRLSAVHKAWANTVAMEVVPVADVFVKALLETAQGANGTKKAVDDMARDGTLLEWAKSAATAAGWVVDSLDGVVRITNAVGKGLGAMAAQAAALMRGDFKAIGEIESMYQTDREAIMMAPLFSETLARRMADIGTTSQAATPGVKSIAAALGDAGEKAAKAAAALADLRMETILRNAKEAAKELDTLAKAQEEYAKALYAGTDAIESQAQSAERELRYYGMTESAIQATIIARLEEARAIAAANGAYPEHLAYLDREIDARQRIATASSQKEFLDTNKRAAEASAREWEKFADDINRSLTDALFRAFESGSGFGKSFADTLGNTLKAAVAKAMINVAITTGSNALNTGINALLGTSAANNGTGTNYFGLSSNASSIYNLANGNYANMAAGAYNYAAAASGYQYGTNFMSQQSLMLAQQDAALGAASGGSLSQSISSFFSGGGWVLALPAIASMLVGSKERYLDTRIRGTLGASGFSGEFGDTYKNTGSLLRAGDSETSWIPASGNRNDIIASDYYNALYGADVIRGTMAEGHTEEQLQSIVDAFTANGGKFADYSAVAGGAIKSALEQIYAGAKSSLETTAKLFGDESLGEKLRGYVANVQIQNSGDAQKMFTDFADTLLQGMGAAWLPTVESLRATTETNGKKITETWSQTFTRLVNEAGAVNTVFDLLGASLATIYGNNTDKILAASDAFVKLFGSIDAMSASINAYYDNFYTAAEKQDRAWQQIEAAMAAIGVTAVPKTREAFRELADSYLKAGDSGAATFKGLMDIQGAFAALVPAAAEAGAAVGRLADDIAQSLLSGFDSSLGGLRASADRNLSALRDAAQLERDRITAARTAASEQIASLQSMLELLNSNAADLRGQAAAGPLAAHAADWLRQAANTAATSGYLPDSAALADAISAARAGLNGPYASSFDRDFAKLTLAGDLDRLHAVAGKQLPIAERALITADAQLAALDDSLRLAEQQVDALFGIDSSVITLQGSIESMSADIVKALKDSIGGINASLLAAVQAGTIGSADAASRLTGVQKDQVTSIGGRNYFISSQGAIASDDGMITANDGWRGTIEDAKKIVSQAFYSMAPADFYTAAKKVGLSSAALDAMYGFPSGTALAWAKSHGLPEFARGANRLPQDMLAVVHKDEAIIPAAYNPALGHSGNARLERLVEAMTLEIQRLNTDLAEMRRDTRRTANAVNGNPEQPMLVETVA